MKKMFILLLVTISLFASNGKGTHRIVQFNLQDQSAAAYDFIDEEYDITFGAWIVGDYTDFIREDSPGSNFVMAPSDSIPYFSTIMINLGEFSTWEVGDYIEIVIEENLSFGGRVCGNAIFQIPEGTEPIIFGFEPFIADTGFPVVMGSCGSIDENGYTPESTSLKQNYPNPFNPTTTIEFDIEKTGMVSLNIYNHEGKIVRNAVDNFMNVGKHSVGVDLSNLSAGTYYYILKVDGISEAKKMVFVK